VVETTAEHADLERQADDIVSRAGKVHRREVGYRGRKSFMKLTLKVGVVNGRIVPKLPATFLGKVKLSSLNSYVAVEEQLRLRDIAGWTPHADGRQPDGPALLNLVGLKALLPTEMVVELTGRGKETAEVVYVCELAKDVQDSVMIDDDVDDDECDGGDSFDAAGAAADAAAAASEAPASVVIEEVGPRRGGRARREVQRD
jgi:hypothetical protein